MDKKEKSSNKSEKNNCSNCRTEFAQEYNLDTRKKSKNNNSKTEKSSNKSN